LDWKVKENLLDNPVASVMNELNEFGHPMEDSLKILIVDVNPNLKIE
jgi:hypothetical protein